MSLIQQALALQAAPTPRSMSLLDLPWDIRREIWQHTFLPGRVRYPTPKTGFRILGWLSVPKSLLLASKQVKAEVLEVYFEKAYTHLLIDPGCSVGGMMHYLDSSQKSAVFIPPATSTRCWCLHLEAIRTIDAEEAPYSDKDPFVLSEDRLRKIVSLLEKNRQILKSAVIQVPCLCSLRTGSLRINEREVKYDTEGSWLSIVPPQLESFSQLRIPDGLLTFAPTKREGFPPCLRPRCKALVSHLKDLTEKVQSQKEQSKEIQKKELQSKKMDLKRSERYLKEVWQNIDSWNLRG
ncbi:MAG: hypothetical protein LQ350_001046 [Teloschistes chrysophthalmus]|nr:MAG: hypothetical protein LQ350_001046 [Niorma chrysophthalma]